MSDTYLRADMTKMQSPLGPIEYPLSYLNSGLGDRACSVPLFGGPRLSQATVKALAWLLTGIAVGLSIMDLQCLKEAGAS